ncbi:SpaA isopeptide-forming pilin-related protein [Eremococcus coleocola]|uniref:SpaA isopeptide-forming pilin-related protein n=1 Tax=Eremococcus coleocola TaxID=88132 RepID=UPI000426A562|nr:SpaA isopeptide-forming pilin-related protein [Eremococcus coleocola]
MTTLNKKIALTLASSLVLASFPMTSLAQTNSSPQISSLYNQEIAQTENLKFEILQKNDAGTFTSLWQSDQVASDSNTLKLLEAGDYIIRVSDQDNFQREANQLDQILLEYQDSSNNQMVYQFFKNNSLKQAEDGSNVYELEFNVKQAIQIDTMRLTLMDADQLADKEAEVEAAVAASQAQMADQISGEDLSQDSSQDSAEPAQDLASLTVTVRDENSSPVANVSIQVGDQSQTSDESGQAIFNDLPAGSLDFKVTQVPEGYQVAEDQNNLTVTLEANTQHTLDLNLISQTAETNTEMVKLSFVNDQGQAIPGVTITYEGQTYTSDEQGQLELPSIGPGAYTYQVTSVPDGYALSQAPQTFDYVENQPVSIHLEKLNQESSPQVTSVSFKVVDQSGQAVPGVTLLVKDQTYQTDDQGQIVIEELPVGESINYQILEVPQGYLGQSEGSIDLSSDQPISEELAIEKTAQAQSLVIPVVDQDQAPVPGLTIQMEEGTSYTSDDQGQLVLRELVAGDYAYTVTEVPQGYQVEKADGLITIQEGQEQGKPIQVIKEASKFNFVIKVVDQDQNPVPDLSLQLADGQAYTSDDQGQIKLTDLSPGDYGYTISELPQGYQVDSPEGKLTVTGEENQAGQIQVTKEATTFDYVLKVVDQDQNPVPGVSLQLADGQAFTSDDQGQIKLTGLSPDDYEYTISELPQGYQVDNPEGKLTITEEENQTGQIQVTKETPKYKLTVKVVDQDQKPVVGAKVQVGDQEETSDQDGLVTFENLPAQDYSYQVTQLPEGYQGQANDTITLTDHDGQGQLQVQRDLAKAQAVIKVFDQDGQAVKGVTIGLGEQEAVTDDKGQVTFKDLEPNKYSLVIKAVPEDYEGQGQEQEIDLTEGMAFDYAYQVSKKIQTGQVTIQVVDNQNNPVPGATIKTGDQELKTDQNGQVTLDQVALGELTYTISQVPDGYQVNQAEQNIVVDHQVQVTTAMVTRQEAASEKEVIVTEDQSVEKVQEEAKAATTAFSDPSTGVQVWINPADAGQVANFKVAAVSNPLDPEPSSLKGSDYQAYQIQLLDSNGQAANLSHIAKIQLPIKTSQGARLVRVRQDQLANLTFGLSEQNMTFNTQEMGTFAVIYGRKADDASQVSSLESSQASQSVTVTKTSSVEKKNNLPGTGENSSLLAYIVPIVVAIVGLVIIIRKPKNDD